MNKMQEARLSGAGDGQKTAQGHCAEVSSARHHIARARAFAALRRICSTWGADQLLLRMIGECLLVLITDTQKTASWILSATKLAGDIHHEQALWPAIPGKYELPKSEFAAVAYEEAAESGCSDAEVYEGYDLPKRGFDSFKQPSFGYTAGTPSQRYLPQRNT
ncbi:MAG: hypothetical protein U0787_14215 [Polyangia bacterium]